MAKTTTGMSGQARNTQYERTLAVAERDVQACRLRETGMSYRAIAAELGESLTTTVHRVKRALATVPVEAVNDLRAIEGARLDEQLTRIDKLDEVAWEVLRREHVAISDGRVVCRNNVPLMDSKPVMDAVASLRQNEILRLRNAESRRKLFGLDEPTRSVVTTITTDVTEQAIAKLEAELAERARADTARGSTT